MRVGGVQETITVTGETPVVDVQSTRREVTLDNETMRACRASGATAICSTRCRACRSNNNNVNTGPVFAHLPGPRRSRRRVASDGGRPEHQQPAGRQPAAELHRRHRQRAGSDDDHVGRPRRIGNRRPHDEHRPEAGRQQHLRPGVRLRLLGGDAVGQLHRRIAGARRHAAEPRVIASTTSTPPSAARSSRTSSGTT